MIPIAASWASQEKHFDPLEGSKDRFERGPESSKARPRGSNLRDMVPAPLSLPSPLLLTGHPVRPLLVGDRSSDSGVERMNNNVNKKTNKTMVACMVILIYGRKNDLIYIVKMIKIQILALSKPNKKITGRGIDQIEHTTTPGEIIDRITQEYPFLGVSDLDLIVDKTASIPRIALNDPVNEYYNGHIGDIYRIVDDSSTRFRMVTGPTVRVKTKTSPYHNVTVGMYYAAYNTVLQMLNDRRNEGEEEEVERLRIKPTDIKSMFDDHKFEALNISGVPNRRGQAMYVYFIPMNDERLITRKRSAGAKAPFKELVTEIIKQTVTDFNIKNEEKLVMPQAIDEKSPEVLALLERLEIIIVYNNQTNDNLVKLDVPVQFFSVQQLVFNVTMHMDQPTFYLLDPIKDRQEILDVLSLNGLVLDKGHAISEFNIKDGAKLILL